MPGYYEYLGKCVAECPTDFRVGDNKKACKRITINDLGRIYFPFLILTAFFLLMIFFGKFKKKAGRTKYINT